jgi:hypothetical protein
MAFLTGLSIIGSLAATGFSAASKAKQAQADKEDLDEQRAIDESRFKETTQQNRRQQNLSSLGFLSGQRQQAVANAPFNTRPSFIRDITKIARGEL